MDARATCLKKGKFNQRIFLHAARTTLEINADPGRVGGCDWNEQFLWLIRAVVPP